MSATDQILAQVKAVQKHYEYARQRITARRTQPEGPKDFPHWFLAGLRRIEEQGASFELLEPEKNNGVQAVRIDWGDHDLIRSMDDFMNEYQAEYLPKFRRVAA